MKETLFPQKSLPLSNSTGVDDISDAVLANYPTMLKAIKVCIDVSGLQDQQVADGLGMNASVFSKYMSGTYNFPQESLLPLMALCGNLIPLRWLAFHAGQKVEPLLSTVEEENERLRAELAEKVRQYETIIEFCKQTGVRV